MKSARVQAISPYRLENMPGFCGNLYPRRVAILKPYSNRRKILEIRGSKEGGIPIGEALAIELGRGVKKLNFHQVQKEEALKRSRELLFAEVCRFSGLNSEDFSSKCRRMGQEERRVLAKDFVAVWGGHFHPLSAKSVKEMLDEVLGRRDVQIPDSNKGGFFPDFGRLLGFSRGIVP